jgi:hypothetical protein
VVNEYNFEAPTGFVSVNSAATVVATVTPAPGIYNVTATATGFNGPITCRVEAASSSAAYSATAPGHASESVTADETGAMSVTSRSVIEEVCTGFSGTEVVHRALTAVEVTDAHGTITKGDGQRPTKVVALPMNSFVGKAGRRARR